MIIIAYRYRNSIITWSSLFVNGFLKLFKDYFKISLSFLTTSTAIRSLGERVAHARFYHWWV